MAKERIGFIGIGLMGHGMAKNLVAKGHPLKFKVNRNRDNIADLLAAGAADALFVYADVVDVAGEPVPDATPLVRFAVDGPARIVGPAEVGAEAGIAAVIVQAGGTPGRVTVTANAPGLRAARLVVAVALSLAGVWGSPRARSIALGLWLGGLLLWWALRVAWIAGALPILASRMSAAPARPSFAEGAAWRFARVLPAAVFALALGLYSEAAECTYLCGNRARREALTKEVLTHAASPLDTVRVRSIAIQEAYAAMATAQARGLPV